MSRTYFQPRFQQVIEALEPDLLKLGDRGQSVRTLQLALQQLNLYRSPVDGRFGSDTATAVCLLQQQYGLPVTGQFNIETWYALSFWAKPQHSDQAGLKLPLLSPFKMRLSQWMQSLIGS